MNKVLKGSAVEKSVCKSPIKKANLQKRKQKTSFFPPTTAKSIYFFSSITASIQSPSHQKTDSLKRNQLKAASDVVAQNVTDHTIYAQVVASNSPKIVAGALKHSAASKGSNFPTPKNSPLRRNPAGSHESPKRSEEKWIDGPRVSKFKVAEARHLMREINHVKQCETWIDGPNIKPVAVAVTTTSQGTSYGYMDNHKKTMIRQWVENQTSQIFQSTGTNTTPTPAPAVQYHQFYKSQQKIEISQVRNDDDLCSISSKNEEFVNPLAAGLSNIPTANVNFSESSIKTGLKQATDYNQDIQSEKSASHISENRQSATGADLEEEDQDQDSGPSEVPPALPLIEPLGSREVSRHVSRESLCQNVMMMDCALQVTEEDIAKAMGG